MIADTSDESCYDSLACYDEYNNVHNVLLLL
jgi:hypothetical protein